MEYMSMGCMIETARLRLYAASREQMEAFVAAQTVEALKAEFGDALYELNFEMFNLGKLLVYVACVFYFYFNLGLNVIGKLWSFGIYLCQIIVGKFGPF